MKEIDELVEEIKVLSRHWSLTRLKIASCLFCESKGVLKEVKWSLIEKVKR